MSADESTQKLNEAIEFLAESVKSGATFVYKQATGCVKEILWFQAFLGIINLAAWSISCAALCAGAWHVLPEVSAIKWLPSAAIAAIVLIHILPLKKALFCSVMPLIAPRLQVLNWITENRWRFK